MKRTSFLKSERGGKRILTNNLIRFRQTIANVRRSTSTTECRFLKGISRRALHPFAMRTTTTSTASVRRNLSQPGKTHIAEFLILERNDVIMMMKRRRWKTWRQDLTEEGVLFFRESVGHFWYIEVLSARLKPTGPTIETYTHINPSPLCCPPSSLFFSHGSLSLSSSIARSINFLNVTGSPELLSTTRVPIYQHPAGRPRGREGRCPFRPYTRASI